MRLQPREEEPTGDTMTKRELIDFMKQMRRVFHSVFLVEFKEEKPCLDEEGLSEEEKQLFVVCNRPQRWQPSKTDQTVERIVNYGSESILVIDHYMLVEQQSCVVELILRNATNLTADRNTLLRSIEQLNEKIYIDSLTGVYNRRYYDEYFEDVYADLSLAIMDIDNFKGFNDTYGHRVGDEVLRQVARTIQNNVRPTDAVIRYGGDEFMLIFMNIPPEIFHRKLEAIRSAVEQTELEHLPQVRMTLSIGGCKGNGKIGALLEQADQYLYQAKKERNAIVLGDFQEGSGS